MRIWTTALIATLLLCNWSLPQSQAAPVDFGGQTVDVTPYDGYYGHSPTITGGPVITLPVGSGVNCDGTMPNTGIQHFSFDVAISSPPYLAGSNYYDWLGLDFGYVWMRQSRSWSYPYCSVWFNALAGTSAPGDYMNPEDLIMKIAFNDSEFRQSFAPGSYRFDFTFDNDNNTTTLNLSGGASASHTWNGTMSVNAFDLASRAWGYGDGSTLQFSNFVYTPEPATLSLLALGGLAMLRRRGLRR